MFKIDFAAVYGIHIQLGHYPSRDKLSLEEKLEHIQRMTPFGIIRCIDEKEIVATMNPVVNDLSTKDSFTRVGRGR